MTNREVEVGRFFRKRFLFHSQKEKNGPQACFKVRSLVFFGGDKISRIDFDCFQIQFRQLRQIATDIA